MNNGLGAYLVVKIGGKMVREIVRFDKKIGEYIGLIKHTKRYNGYQLAMVKFFGNKRVSRVPYSELKFFTDEELKEMIISVIENQT